MYQIHRDVDSHSFIGHFIIYGSNVQPELNGANSSQGRAYSDGEKIRYRTLMSFTLSIYGFVWGSEYREYGFEAK